uniref:F-box domain-containing protein n=1 Tax=Aegilops tauschii subsp. strangulata TaxID=200361 RepID=A0A453HX07_AEGTS
SLPLRHLQLLNSLTHPGRSLSPATPAAMKGADLINVALPEELLEDVLRRVGGEKRDLDACALVCRRWRRLDRATRRSAKLPASGVHADEVVGLFVERFPALADVSIDERLSADAAVVSAPASRSRRHVSDLDLMAKCVPFGACARESCGISLPAANSWIEILKSYSLTKCCIWFIG